MTGNHWKNQCLNDEGSKHYTSKKCTNIKQNNIVFKKQYCSTLGENMGSGYKHDNKRPKMRFSVL